MAKREANTQATRITRAVNAEANRDAKPSSIEELKSVLHEHRMSATPGRLAILGFFQNDLSHPDVESVQAAVTGQNPGISKTTVYRILEEFAQHGLIRPFSTDGRRKRYDGNTKPHHHLICNDCGRVEDLMPEENTNVRLSKKQSRGYNIEYQTITFYGRCEDCESS